MSDKTKVRDEDEMSDSSVTTHPDRDPEPVRRETYDPLKTKRMQDLLAMRQSAQDYGQADPKSAAPIVRKAQFIQLTNDVDKVKSGGGCSIS